MFESPQRRALEHDAISCVFEKIRASSPRTNADPTLGRTDEGIDVRAPAASATDGIGPSRVLLDQCTALTEIRRGLTRSDFGRRILSTPWSNEASTPEPSTSSGTRNSR